MLEVNQGNVQKVNMDYHGLIGTICKDLKIAERIDAELGKDPKTRW